MKIALYILAAVSVLSLVVFLVTKSQTPKEEEEKKIFSLSQISEIFKRKDDEEEPAESEEP